MDLYVSAEAGKQPTRHQHTPDFLLVYKNRVVVTEWREESRLFALAAKGNQFYKDQNHVWHYRCAEEYFRQLGIVYEIHSAVELPHKFVQNVRFLNDYSEPSCLPLSAEVIHNLSVLLRERGRIQFLELVKEYSFSADDIFRAVLQGLVYTNLYTQRLDLAQDLIIYRDELIARVYETLDSRTNPPPLPYPGMLRLVPGTIIHFNGQRFIVALVAAGQVLLKDEQRNTITLPLKDVEEMYCSTLDIDAQAGSAENTSNASLSDFSNSQLETGIRRLEAIDSNDESVPQRNRQRWKRRASTEATRMESLIALIPRDSLKGNRTPRLPDAAEELANEVIDEFFNTPECRTAIAAFAKYSVACSNTSVVPMSYQTFCKRVKSRGSSAKREGKRKAYQTDSIPLYLDYRQPIHGVRPHEVCYVDHTIMNIALAGLGGSDLGKPCFTLAIDGHTTQSRAFYLSFDPPCARSVLMVLRDYVRRNHRLPKVLVVDGGREFRSKELQQFCRIFGIELRHRPPARPRSGSPIERAMGYTETELLAQLRGNTRILKNVRMVTKSVNPFQFREWTLPALWGALEEFLFYLRDNRPHPTLGLSPREFEAKRTIETGAREHTLVRFDSNLLLLTCPHTKHRIHRVDRIRGVWADNALYWHNDFRSAKPNENVEVRVEPWNASVVYVMYRGKWIPAISRDTRALINRSSYEVELAIRAERRRAKVTSNSSRLSVKHGRHLLSLLSPTAFDPRIHEQQQEMLTLYERLGMGCAVRMEASPPSNSQQQSTHESEKPDREQVEGSIEKSGHLDRNECDLEIPLSESLDSNFWKDNDDYV